MYKIFCTSSIKSKLCFLIYMYMSFTANSLCIGMINEQSTCEPRQHEPDFKEIRGERGGSVVECRTPEQEVGGSIPTAAVLCPWARHFSPRKYWLITQEAVALSRHDWKIVDWDVKPQHKQTNKEIRMCICIHVSSIILGTYIWIPLDALSCLGYITVSFAVRVNNMILNMSHSMTKPANWPVHPAKTLISLGIYQVWSDSSMCTLRIASDSRFFMRTAKTDQTRRMPRLIGVFAVHTSHFVGFVIHRLNYDK